MTTEGTDICEVKQEIILVKSDKEQNIISWWYRVKKEGGPQLKQWFVKWIVPEMEAWSGWILLHIHHLLYKLFSVEWAAVELKAKSSDFRPNVLLSHFNLLYKFHRHIPTSPPDPKLLALQSKMFVFHARLPAVFPNISLDADWFYNSASTQSTGR